MKRTKSILTAVLLALAFIAQALTGGVTVRAAEANVEVQKNGLSKTIEGGAILHVWCWNFNTIKEKIPEIAAAGFSAIQTSPISNVNNGGNGSLTINGGDNWWWHYQPTDYKIGNYQLGTKDEFKAMCDVAHAYGVKVIVDSVVNHMTSDYSKISEEFKSITEKPFHPMGDEREKDQNWSEVDRYEETQYDLSGLYELNTQNKDVQEYVLNFLKDCVENGADGFRYDAAKLIELPDDTSEKYGNDFASDWWPTILQNGAVFQYGEVLQEGGVHKYGEDASGYNDNDSSRLGAYHSQTFVDKNGAPHDFNTTNSYTGWRVRDAIAEKNLSADFIMDPLLPAGAKANQTVTWVESHDNYCNDASYNELTETQQVIQAWAAIAARKDGTPLFFDRPAGSSAASPWGDNKIGPEGSDMYKDPQVAAVNFFRNEMAGTDQKAINPIEGNSQVLLIERGASNKGCVIINASDKDVLISADTTMPDGTKMADGNYVDQAYKGAFEVADGILTGTVRAGKVAVVYASNINEDDKEKFEPAVNLSMASGYFLTEELNVGVTVRACDKVAYELVVNGNKENAQTGFVADGDVINAKNLNDLDVVTVTLTGCDKNDNVLAQVEREYTKWVKKDNTVVYLDPVARPEWKNYRVYVWSNQAKENAGWPGVAPEVMDNGLLRYVLPFEYEFEGVTGNVIFNNGSGGGNNQFDAGSLVAGQQKIYTFDGRWVDYTEEEFSKPAVSFTKGTSYIPVGTETEVGFIIKNVASAKCTMVVNGNREDAVTGDAKNGDTLKVSDYMDKHMDTVELTLVGYDKDGKELITATETYTAWEKQDNTVVYLEKAARPEWTAYNIYIWGSAENAGWPGEAMEEAGEGLVKYVLPLAYELEGSEGNVIFNNGSGEQFDAGKITAGQKKIYTAEGEWKDYEEPAPAPVLAEEITINKATATLYTGETLQLTAKVSPEDAEDGAISWKSGKTAVATVSKDGLVTAKSAGAVKIRAMTEGGLKVYCKITVKAKQVYQAVKGSTVLYLTSLSTAKSLKAKGYTVTRVFFAAGTSKTPVYSVYSAKSKHYRYTTDRAYALEKKKAGLKVSVAFYAAVSKGTPVYELVKSGSYRYTTSRTEAKSLKKKGYTYKGIVWQAEKV